MKSSIVSLLLWCACSLHAQSPPAERLIRECISAFNAGEDTMRAFYANHAVDPPPVDERMNRYRKGKAEFGTLTIDAVAFDGPQSASVKLTSAKGASLSMMFEFTSGPDVKISRQGIRMGGGPGRLPPPDGPKITEPEALQQIAALVEKQSKDDIFSGVVLVARGDEILLEKAAGYYNINGQAPNRPDTMFNIGSIVKVMTKLCIARLWSERKLSLDDTISKFLPDYPNQEAAKSVNIRHLLTMTSGIGDFFGSKYAATPKDRLDTLAAHLPLFAAEPLAFPPGTSEKYSNGGYVVLGLIIEKVTGMSYYDFVQQTIFDPLGMKRTGFFEVDLPRPGLATGYTRRTRGEPRRSNIYTLSRRGTSAGGAYSTVRDLHTFARALQSKKLEPKDAPPEFRVGGAGTLMGGSPGVNSAIASGIPGGYIAIAMGNYDGPAAVNMTAEIRAILGRVTR